MNISFLCAKLPYSKICGTKVDTSYKKRRHCNYNGVEYNGYHSYDCGEQNVVVYFLDGIWFFSKNGLPGNGAFYFQFSVESDTTCPPIGKWGDNYVFCKTPFL